jgi:penicillin-binding protein 1A
MTVRLAQGIGMDKVVDYAQRFGVVDKLQPVLSMSLGAGETTVMRMTTAYSMMVNGGKKVVPTLIDRVQDHTGSTVFRHDSRSCAGCQGVVWSPDAEPPEIPDNREQVADPRTVYQMVSILEGVVQRGTGRIIAEIKKPLAGKTGTTNDYNDAWFVGFSPDLAVGLYIGFDQPRSLGPRESGSGVAAPVFKEFMEVALQDKPATPFRIPPGLRLVRVDPRNGHLAEAGERGAIWEAFKPGTEPQPGDNFVLDGSEMTDGSGTLIPTQGGGSMPDSPGGTGGIY